eukprot:g12115.t1
MMSRRLRLLFPTGGLLALGKASPSAMVDIKTHIVLIGARAEKGAKQNSRATDFLAPKELVAEKPTDAFLIDDRGEWMTNQRGNVEGVEPSLEADSRASGFLSANGPAAASQEAYTKETNKRGAWSTSSHEWMVRGEDYKPSSFSGIAGGPKVKSEPPFARTEGVDFFRSGTRGSGCKEDSMWYAEKENGPVEQLRARSDMRLLVIVHWRFLFAFLFEAAAQSKNCQNASWARGVCYMWIGKRRSSSSRRR